VLIKSRYRGPAKRGPRYLDFMSTCEFLTFQKRLQALTFDDILIAHITQPRQAAA
jgi:hypothetical protein